MVPKGLASLLVLLIIVILFIFIGGAIYWAIGGQQFLDPALNKNSVDNCNLENTPREFNAQNYYEGPLIDSHIHMPVSSIVVSKVAQVAGFTDMPVLGGDLSIDYLNCLFESEGITKVFGFNIIPRVGTSQSVNTVAGIAKKYPDKFVNFFMPPPINYLYLNSAATKRYLDDNPALFKGYGEVAFYMESFGELQPDDPDMMNIYEIAGEKNMIVMLHVSESQQKAAEQVVSKNPNVTFLFHGEDYIDWIDTMMNTYDNFYYSIDANVLDIYGFDFTHNENGPTKQEYISHMRNDFDEVLSRHLSTWQNLIEKYPNRFLWGTDRWYSWHFDQDIGAILEEYSRAFIGSLDPIVQDNFAFKNAENLLQEF